MQEHSRTWLKLMRSAATLPEAGDLGRDEVRDLIVAAFGAALRAAQQVDPELQLALS